MVIYDKKESSSSSSEETQTNRIRENADSSGVGRSYECVYCKRGFNTAQALGGHMNIHRKDRAKKNKPSTSNKPIENIYANPNLHLKGNLPNSAYHDHSSLNRDYLQLGVMNNGTYFPGSLISASSDGYFCGEVLYDRNQQYCTKDYFDSEDHRRPSNPSMESFDWTRRLSSEYSPVVVEDVEMNKQVIDHDEDLDLELRLGYD